VIFVLERVPMAVIWIKYPLWQWESHLVNSKHEWINKSTCIMTCATLSSFRECTTSSLCIVNKNKRRNKENRPSIEMRV
jgi:hypothetical protein